MFTFVFFIGWSVRQLGRIINILSFTLLYFTLRIIVNINPTERGFL